MKPARHDQGRRRQGGCGEDRELSHRCPGHSNCDIRMVKHHLRQNRGCCILNRCFATSTLVTSFCCWRGDPAKCSATELPSPLFITALSVLALCAPSLCVYVVHCVCVVCVCVCVQYICVCDVHDSGHACATVCMQVEVRKQFSVGQFSLPPHERWDQTKAVILSWQVFLTYRALWPSTVYPSVVACARYLLHLTAADPHPAGTGEVTSQHVHRAQVAALTLDGKHEPGRERGR